jgi:hypothetical protein
MERVLWAIPAQRKRKYGAQDRNGTQQVNGPEPTAIPVAVVQRTLVESAVLRLNSFKQRGQPARRLGRRQGLEGFQSHPGQQQPLNYLVQRHGISQPTSS